MKTTGDGFHAVFTTAHDAIGAAAAAQRVLTSEQWAETGALKVRMGVHTGTAELRDGTTTARRSTGPRGSWPWRTAVRSCCRT